MAALCMLSGVARAQSGLTLYGVIDTNIEYVNQRSSSTGASGPNFGVNTGGLAASRFGFRGVEDLGNGLRALFVLEGQFNSDTGSMVANPSGTRLFDRQAFVGLEDGSFGRLTFGRQYTSLFIGLASYSPTAYTLYEPFMFMTGLAYRSDNVVNYSGKFGPVAARAHYSFGNGVYGPGETPGNARANTGYGAALDYSNGPFGVVIAYDQFNPTLPPPFADSGIGRFRKAALAGGYNIGAFRLTAGYRWGKDEFSNGVVAMRDDLFWAGVGYQATPALNFVLAYYYDKLHTVRSTPSGVSSPSSNPYQISFLTTYEFTKRTSIYLSTAYSKNSALGFQDVSSTESANIYMRGKGMSSQFGAALGIRHIF
ncbi:porin [Cupriavidus sp. 8B]